MATMAVYSTTGSVDASLYLSGLAATDVVRVTKNGIEQTAITYTVPAGKTMDMTVLLRGTEK